MADRTLRVCALYPDLMNIYADRGNLLFLERRCQWRGIGFELTGAHPGDAGGPRRARPLLPRRRAGSRPGAVRAGPGPPSSATPCTPPPTVAPVVFAVCGGHQLLGHSYQLGGDRAPRRRPRRPPDRPRERPAADWQRRHRGRAAASAVVARRFRESRGPYAPGTGASRSGACSPATGTTAPRVRGRARRAARHRGRHLSPRSAAPKNA